EGELIAAVHVPAMTDGARWGYYKFCRKAGEFAEASCAAWFEGELIAAVHVPAMTDGARWGYYKFCRKAGEFA
ncbi:hypothetical protein CKW47_21420, partial [Bordetella pertussis]